MLTNIGKPLAQQIVSTVKDVCGQDINFIDESGIIFASTDEKRIGTYHEIGRKAALTGTAIEVDTDNSFTGTQKGINMPVYHNHAFVAVVGITGDPEDVRKYAHLAERITHLMLREKELHATSRTQEDKRHFIIQSLIGNLQENRAYLMDCLSEYSIAADTPKRLILIRVSSRYNMVNRSMLEQKIYQLFQSIPLPLFTFQYPNEYLALAEERTFSETARLAEQFAASYHEFVKIAVGKSCDLFQLAESYHSALTALKSIENATESYVLFDNLTLEIILSSLSTENRTEFLQKTTAKLTDDDKHILCVYFEEDMSLSRTCAKLFLHKNTLQYKLNHIWQVCGRNPRKFRDAVLLYLALKVQK